MIIGRLHCLTAKLNGRGFWIVCSLTPIKFIITIRKRQVYSLPNFHLRRRSSHYKKLTSLLASQHMKNEGGERTLLRLPAQRAPFVQVVAGLVSLRGRLERLWVSSAPVGPCYVELCTGGRNTRPGNDVVICVVAEVREERKRRHFEPVGCYCGH